MCVQLCMLHTCVQTYRLHSLIIGIMSLSGPNNVLIVNFFCNLDFFFSNLTSHEKLISKLKISFLVS